MLSVVGGKMCVSSMSGISFLFLISALSNVTHSVSVPDVQPPKIYQDNSSCINIFNTLEKRSSEFQSQDIDRVARNFTFTHTQGLISTGQFLPNSDNSCNSPDSILDILPQLEKVNELLTSLGTTCKQVLSADPNAESGFYELLLPNGSFSTIYCDMEGTHCDGQGGWMRIAHIDMNQPNGQCPSPLVDHQYANINHGLCGRPAGLSPGCSSVSFKTFGYNFTAVCGQAKGYQYGSPDAFNNNENINGAYVDGLSITYGNPRMHIWSYAGGLEQRDGHAPVEFVCPCNQGLTISTPLFVGNDYYCESGVPLNQHWQHNVLYANDALWDGQTCQSDEASCCLAPKKMPWFLKSLGEVVHENIELRFCGNEGSNNEDTPIEIFEMYIR